MSFCGNRGLTLEVLVNVRKPILGSSSCGCLILCAGHPTGEVGVTEGSFPQSSCLVQGICSARSRHKGGVLLPMHLVWGVPTACLLPLGWPKGPWSP